MSGIGRHHTHGLGERERGNGQRHLRINDRAWRQDDERRRGIVRWGHQAHHDGAMMGMTTGTMRGAMRLGRQVQGVDSGRASRLASPSV